MLETQPAVCVERAALATESYRAHEQDPIVLKRAYMLDSVLRGMSIYIDPDALIAGNQASADRAAPIFPEYAMDWVVEELDGLDKRDGDRFSITEDNKRVLRDIYPYWKGRTLKDKGYAAFPERSRTLYDLGIIKTEGNITSGDGHIAVNYERALMEGLHGARGRVQAEISALELHNYEDLKKSYLYRAMLIVLDAAEAFALRFAELADSMADGLEANMAGGQTGDQPVKMANGKSVDLAAKIAGNRGSDPASGPTVKMADDRGGDPASDWEKTGARTNKPVAWRVRADHERADHVRADQVHADRERITRLREIARICRKVPMRPADTFHEAVQSVWLLHVILQIESNGHSLSFGRFDQYMYPYYLRSKAEGMSDEQACELLENLWLRVFSINKIRSWSHTRFSAGSPLYQNVTIGGQIPYDGDGGDGVGNGDGVGVDDAVLRGNGVSGGNAVISGDSLGGRNAEINGDGVSGGNADISEDSVSGSDAENNEDTEYGADAVNEFSFLVLRSVARCRLPQPNLTVRYHKGLSERFMDECVQVIRCGFGMPAFNNDGIIIPSLIDIGVGRKDAYNYSAIGCVEVAVPGKWGYRCTGMSFLNFPKTLMIALNDGVDIDSGTRVAEGTGHFLEMESFGDVMRAWDIFVRDFCRQAVVLDSCADMILEQEAPDILCSALTEDCIGRGKHIKEGGAIYDFISDLQVGIANLGDSLAALKKCVYEDKSVSRGGLWDALLTDYKIEGGERIRKLLLAAPKYGNDDDYADSLVVEGYDSYIDEIAKLKNTRYGRGPIGGRYFAGTSSISANVPQGAVTCATPDGRHAGEPLAEGCSPAHGADIGGPTAVFNSIAKLRTEKITGGVLLNQKVAPAVLEKPPDRAKLAMLLRTFFDALRGFHVQYNVVSRDTLLDAQKHPEKHADLIVRVAGYSAFFNVLSKQTQDDIIARTEQTF